MLPECCRTLLVQSPDTGLSAEVWGQSGGLDQAARLRGETQMTGKVQVQLCKDTANAVRG